MPKIPRPAAVLAFDSPEAVAGVALVLAGVEAAEDDIFSK